MEKRGFRPKDAAEYAGLSSDSESTVRKGVPVRLRLRAPIGSRGILSKHPNHPGSRLGHSSQLRLQRLDLRL